MTTDSIERASNESAKNLLKQLLEIDVCFNFGPEEELEVIKLIRDYGDTAKAEQREVDAKIAEAQQFQMDCTRDAIVIAKAIRNQNTGRGE